MLMYWKNFKANFVKYMSHVISQNFKVHYISIRMMKKIWNIKNVGIYIYKAVFRGKCIALLTYSTLEESFKINESILCLMLEKY